MRRSRIKFTSLKSGALDKTDTLDENDVLDESSPKKDNNKHVINSKDKERQKRRIHEANLNITIDEEEKEKETDDSYDYDNDLDQELLDSGGLSPIQIEKTISKELDKQIDKENEEFSDDDNDGTNNYNDDEDAGHGEENITQINTTVHRSYGVTEYINNSSSSLQPLTSRPTDDINTRKISNEVTEKVTSFEKERAKRTPEKDGSDIKRRKIYENSQVDTESAESTILKITEFINSKRKELKDLEKRKLNGGSEINNNKNSAVNNKNNLMKKIKRLNYNYNWSMDEWIALYQYLRLWKHTEDDRLLDSYRLEKLFNCNIEELQIRIKSLKNLIDAKKRSIN